MRLPCLPPKSGGRQKCLYQDDCKCPSIPLRKIRVRSCDLPGAALCGRPRHSDTDIERRACRHSGSFAARSDRGHQPAHRGQLEDARYSAQAIHRGLCELQRLALQEAALAQINATLPPLRKALATQRDMLSALVLRKSPLPTCSLICWNGSVAATRADLAEREQHLRVGFFKDQRNVRWSSAINSLSMTLSI
jgi:uncharacterized coiled-coil protein SlyX